MSLRSVWNNMKKRCHDPQSTGYERYGGRGIKVCNEWKESFQEFSDYVSKLEHFGEEGYTLDRIDNEGDYCPGNLRWADKKTQQRNTRNNHLIEYDGRQMSVAEAAELSGISYSVLIRRINGGVPAQEWFLPVGKRGNKKGIRYGGKPKGWRKPEGVRPQKQMRAYPEEWELIQRFAKLVKYSDKDACQKFLDEQESK